MKRDIYYVDAVWKEFPKMQCNLFGFVPEYINLSNVKPLKQSKLCQSTGFCYGVFNAFRIIQ